MTTFMVFFLLNFVDSKLVKYVFPDVLKVDRAVKFWAHLHVAF